MLSFHAVLSKDPQQLSINHNLDIHLEIPTYAQELKG